MNLMLSLSKIKKRIKKQYRILTRQKMSSAYQVAYRRVKRGGLLDKEPGQFMLIPNPSNGFAADPFLFEFDRQIYIFAELYDDAARKGYLGYCKLNRFGPTKWKKAIEEDYHLSYPCIFESDGNIWIAPEANNSQQLYFYKAIRFPDVWEKQAPLSCGFKFVDSTVFKENDEVYMFTSKKLVNESILLLLQIDQSFERIVSEKKLHSDLRYSRCAGNVLSKNNLKIRVAQNCSEKYGNNLEFLSFAFDKNGDYSEKCIQSIYADEIKINGTMKLKRIHTYNRLNDVEVIDCAEK